MNPKLPPNILCVAAVKYAELEQILKIIEQGYMHLGWSTVQQFLKLAPLLPKNCRHHFIGHLQTNKVAQLLQHDMELIHSIDSEKILRKINENAETKNKIQKILLQIKTDPTKKHGFAFDEVEKNLESWKKFTNIEIIGLMTILPDQDAEKNRQIFQKMKKFSQKLKLPQLSMGMSDDYKIAIEEGATIVRLGRILFHSPSLSNTSDNSSADFKT